MNLLLEIRTVSRLQRWLLHFFDAPDPKIPREALRARRVILVLDPSSHEHRPDESSIRGKENSPKRLTTKKRTKNAPLRDLFMDFNLKRRLTDFPLSLQVRILIGTLLMRSHPIKALQVDATPHSQNWGAKEKLIRNGLYYRALRTRDFDTTGVLRKIIKVARDQLATVAFAIVERTATNHKIKTDRESHLHGHEFSFSHNYSYLFQAVRCRIRFLRRHTANG